MTLVLVVAGCGSGTKTVDRHAVEQGAKDALAIDQLVPSQDSMSVFLLGPPLE